MAIGRENKDLKQKLKNKEIRKVKRGKPRKFQTSEELMLATKKIANYKNLSGNQIAKKLGYTNKSSLNALCDSLRIARDYYKRLE